MLVTAADAIRWEYAFSYGPFTFSLHPRNRRFTLPADSSFRNVRRVILFLTLAGLALAAAAPAHPAALSAARVQGSESVELSFGRGFASLADRGATLGNVRRGWIRVVDLSGGGPPSGWVRGCESRTGRLSGRVYCSGTDLRFYIHGGTWRIRMKGGGINVSAVIRGSLGLDRERCSSCTYKIGDRPERRWPATLRFFAVRS